MDDGLFKSHRTYHPFLHCMHDEYYRDDRYSEAYRAIVHVKCLQLAKCNQIDELTSLYAFLEFYESWNFLDSSNGAAETIFDHDLHHINEYWRITVDAELSSELCSKVITISNLTQNRSHFSELIQILAFYKFKLYC